MIVLREWSHLNFLFVGKIVYGVQLDAVWSPNVQGKCFPKPENSDMLK
jgi:hypothetical protein